MAMVNNGQEVAVREHSDVALQAPGLEYDTPPEPILGPEDILKRMEQVLHRLPFDFRNNETAAILLLKESVGQDPHICESVLTYFNTQHDKPDGGTQAAEEFMSRSLRRAFMRAHTLKTFNDMREGKAYGEYNNQFIAFREAMNTEIVGNRRQSGARLVHMEKISVEWDSISKKAFACLADAYIDKKYKATANMYQAIQTLQPTADHPVHDAILLAYESAEVIRRSGTPIQDVYEQIRKNLSAPVGNRVSLDLEAAALESYGIVATAMLQNLLARGGKLSPKQAANYANLHAAMDVKHLTLDPVTPQVFIAEHSTEPKQESKVTVVATRNPATNKTETEGTIVARTDAKFNKNMAAVVMGVIGVGAAAVGLHTYVVDGNHDPKSSLQAQPKREATTTPATSPTPPFTTAETTVGSTAPLDAAPIAVNKVSIPQPDPQKAERSTVFNPKEQVFEGFNNLPQARAMTPVAEQTPPANYVSEADPIIESAPIDSLQASADKIIAAQLLLHPEVIKNQDTTGLQMITQAITQTESAMQQRVNAEDEKYANDPTKVRYLYDLHAKHKVFQARNAAAVAIGTYPGLGAYLTPNATLTDSEQTFVASFNRLYFPALLGEDPSGLNQQQLEAVSNMLAINMVDLFDDRQQVVFIERLRQELGKAPRDAIKTNEQTDQVVDQDEQPATEQEESPNVSTQGQRGDSDKTSSSTSPKASEKNDNEQLEQRSSEYAAPDRELSQQQETLLQKLEAKGSQWDNRVYLMRYFMTHEVNGKYLSMPQIAGMIGNYGLESGSEWLDPAAVQPGASGRGLAQWGNKETKAYDRFGHFDGANQEGTLLWFAAHVLDGEPWDTVKAQTMFTHYELQNDFKGAASDLMEATSVKDATYAFMNEYEIPGVPHFDERLAIAEEAFDVISAVLDDMDNSDNAVTEKAEQAEESLADRIADELDISADAVTIHEANGYQHIEFDREVGEKMLNIPAFGSYAEEYREQPLDALVDKWRMYSRECVSYVASRVSNDKFPGEMPIWGGNDNQPNVPGTQSGTAMYWLGNARAAGIPVDDTPAVGSSIAWNTNGPEHSSMGHVAYVEKVLDDGSIIISQYNNGGTGEFSISGITKADLLKQRDQIGFIHFERADTNTIGRFMVSPVPTEQAVATAPEVTVLEVPAPTQPPMDQPLAPAQPTDSDD